MSGRVLVWAGSVLFVAAAVGMGVFFAHVGLDKANKTAGLIGVFIALTGLALSTYGMLAQRRRSTSDAPASSGGHVLPRSGSGDTFNTVTGGTFHDGLIQGRDITGQPSHPSSPSGITGEHTR